MQEKTSKCNIDNKERETADSMRPVDQKRYLVQCVYWAELQ